jgi:hypothetical protein
MSGSGKMKIQNWSVMAMIRNAWKSVVEQANSHTELWCKQETELLLKKDKTTHRQIHFYNLFYGIYIT